MADLVRLLARHGGGDDDGGDESMAMPGESAMANEMSNTFHASSKDSLWISPFVPSTAAAVLGACVLLFFVAVLTCFLSALQRSLTIKWAKHAGAARPSSGSADGHVPFILSNDLQRGLLYMTHAGLLYLLMLAVMTYNAYYFVSILIGIVVGETAFGRFGRLGTPTVGQSSGQHTSNDNTPLQSQNHLHACSPESKLE